MASRPRAPSTRSSTRTKTTAPAAPPRTTRTASKSTAATVATAPKKTAARKPLVNRANSPETKAAARNVPLKSSQSGSIELPPDTDREPIKAYLRIRPRLDEGEPGYEPYLEPLSDTSVRMTDPSSSTSRSRMSTVNPTSIYTFSHIFPPDTQQPEFFSKTTLPLVRDVLEGRNGLLFTYGVTNSGKTYTIQGGNTQGSAGILPRTLDVIFNSIEGLHGDDRYRPVRLQGIELASESDEPTTIRLPTKNGAPALADVLGDDLPSAASADADPTTLKLDRNYEYTIWLSYAEVYNEKVYDLFGSLESGAAPSSTSQGTPVRGNSAIPRPTSSFLNLPVPSNNKGHPLLLTRKALTVKPCPLSDGDVDGDATSAGKYIAGLRQVRVRSAAEAKELLRLGQLHRRVFGTLANSQSSRSHALVTIKVLRVHRGERHDPTSIQTARLTLVDLAGSERTKHTHTSGDRLREAGNINKSLMVLGQCMETLRANQRALARSLQQGVAPGSRLDTRDVKRGLALVPFRHSKLTEVLMDYFVGEGRAVMIVNVNPYDTGFDENVHVMKFAALAREVCTVPATNAPRVPPSPSKPKVLNGSRVSSGANVPHRRQVTISLGGAGRKASEAHLEVLEEDEELDDGEETSVEDDEPINPLVNALFDEIEELRMQLYEAHIRCALIEAETREEVMGEMEERMRSMEDMFARRLMRVMEHNEEKMDAKLDMIQRSRMLSGGGCVPRSEGGYSDSVADSIDSDAIGQLRMSDTGEYEDGQSSAAGHDADESNDSVASAHSNSEPRSRTPSPLAGKGKPTPKRQSTIRPRTTPPSKVKPAVHPIPGTDDEMDVDETETDDDETASLAEDDGDAEEDEVEDEIEEEEEDSDEDDFIDDEAESPSEFESERDSIEEWSESEASEVITAKAKPKVKAAPAKSKASQATPLAAAQAKRAAQPATRGRRSTRASSSSRAVAELGEDLDALSLGGDPDDSTIVIPNRKAREEAAAGTEYVPKKGETDTGKKKKRQLGKGRVVTEDEIESLVAEGSQEGGRQLRRSTRGNR
ncbi:kinesin-domain-containing protein [Pilatotrama ljubarskyi]|nr:kinesin-domain-containing protein [Pilatotrama ljubarskyi]